MTRNRFICQMLHEYMGYFYDYGNVAAGGGIHVLERPGYSLKTREIIAGRLTNGNFTTLALSHDARTIYFAFSERSERKPAFNSPTITFSMEGDIFPPTGINKEKLWLHYNFLPVWDTPTPNKPHVPPYVFLTEALELCHTISDVEDMLSETDRDGGMLLFAVHAKNNEFLHFLIVYVRNITEGSPPRAGLLGRIIIVLAMILL